jgi:hypothetical protein
LVLYLGNDPTSFDRIPLRRTATPSWMEWHRAERVHNLPENCHHEESPKWQRLANPANQVVRCPVLTLHWSVGVFFLAGRCPIPLNSLKKKHWLAD